jgi:hypothetical protein
MHCFESGDYLQGENLTSFDRATTTLVHCFFLEASLFKSPEFMCCLGGGCIIAAKAGMRKFFFLSFFYCVHPYYPLG